MWRSYLILKQWWKTWGTLPVMTWVKAAALYKKGQFSQAAKYYEKGLKTFPKHAASNCARLDLSYCLFKQLQFEEAERHLKHVISQGNNTREAYDRLGKLHLWTANYIEAAWTYRRALDEHHQDIEFIFGLTFSVLSNGGPGYLIQEAGRTLQLIPEVNLMHPRIKLAKAIFKLYHSGIQGIHDLDFDDFISLEKPQFEALTFYSEFLLEQGNIVSARNYLRQALSQSPNNPRVLNLLANSYLVPGEFSNPGFARQLATTAAQNTRWLSPFALHTLADAHYAEGDKMTALVIASKAKDVGYQRLGAYRGAANLNQLIERLSSSTLA